MISEKDIEQLEKYLLGELSDDEAGRVDKRLESDPEFKAALQELKEVYQAVKQYSRLRLLNKLNKIGNARYNFIKKAVFIAASIVSVALISWFILHVPEKDNHTSNPSTSEQSIIEQAPEIQNPPTVIENSRKIERSNDKENENLTSATFDRIQSYENQQTNQTDKSRLIHKEADLNSISPQQSTEKRVHTSKENLKIIAQPESGCAPLTVKFMDSSNLNAQLIKKITWDFGNHTYSHEKHPEIVYNQPGKYTVTLQIELNDGQVLQKELTSGIKVYASPEASFEVEPEKAILSEAQFNFINQTLNTEGKVFYKWNFGDGTGIVKEYNPVHTYIDTGKFTITLVATNSYRCKSEYSRVVEVFEDLRVFVPDVFRPENYISPENSKFRVMVTGAKEFHLLIYDRNGTLMYESRDYATHGWDGNTAAGPAPMGSYVYKLKVKGMDDVYRDFSGIINLVR